MATIRLVPSVSAVSNSSYALISNASNMYTNTDSTTHGIFTHNRASTSNTYYGYLRGFNFDDVPSSAVVSGFTVKIKASATGHTTSTSSSYYMSLVNGTTQIGSTSASGRLSTTVTTFTFAEGSLTWDTIKGYGSNFGIRIPMRRASSNTQDVVSVYGAEIEVTYTLPVYHDVTLTNQTSATVAVSDTHPMEGDDVTVTTDILNGITVTDNGVDVTSQFVQGGSDSVTAYPGSYTTSGSISGTRYQQCIGNSADDTSVTGNDYASSSGSTAHIDYSFDFSDIPSGSAIQSVSVKVCGHCESTSSSSEVATLRLYSGSTAKGSEAEFESTSNYVVTMTPGTWTREELQSAILRFTIGYYGGAISGVTWTVTYEVDGYVYTITNITADHVIVVTSGGGGPQLYVKENGQWVSVTKAYVKTNGAWVETTLNNVFQQGKKYVKA